MNEEQDYNVFSIRTFTTACTSYSMPQTSVSLGIYRKFLNVLFCSVYGSKEASSSSKEQFLIASCCSNSLNTFIYSKITRNGEILEARNMHREEKNPQRERKHYLNVPHFFWTYHQKSRSKALRPQSASFNNQNPRSPEKSKRKLQTEEQLSMADNKDARLTLLTRAMGGLYCWLVLSSWAPSTRPQVNV